MKTLNASTLSATLTLGVLAALLTTGCLGTTYAIPEGELDRLVNLPAAERGRSVRVVQETALADTPPELEPRTGAPEGCDDLDEDDGDAWVECEDYYTHHQGHSYVYIHSHPGHHHHHGGGAVAGGSSGGRGVTPIRQPGPASSGGGKIDLNVGDHRALAALVVVGAGVFTVGLVATEGARYDGWVQVDPDHPVHIQDRAGSFRVVPLSDLSSEDLDGAARAVLVPDQGEAFAHQRRAPLDRVGFAWKMELGTTQLASPQLEGDLFPAAFMSIGAFPAPWAGLHAFVTLTGGTHGGGDVFGSRYGLTLELIPLQIGRIHIGAFGLGGLDYEVMQGGELQDEIGQVPVLGGGLLVEADLTTRLGLSLRSGATWSDRADGGDAPAFMTTLGVSVY